MGNFWQSEVLEAINNQNLLKLKQIFITLDDSDKQFTMEDGKNLLHYTSNQINEHTLPIVQFLLESGLDPQAIDKNFISPLDIAKEYNNKPVLAMMNYFIMKRNRQIEQYFD